MRECFLFNISVRLNFMLKFMLDNLFGYKKDISVENKCIY